MATTQKNTSKEVATTQSFASSSDLIQAIGENSPSNEEIIFGTLESMDETNFIPLTGEYLKLEANKEYVIVAIDFVMISNRFRTETNGQSEEVEALQFKMRNPVSKEIQQYTNAESVLLNTVKEQVNKGLKLPAAFRIVTHELKESKTPGKGKYLNMEIGLFQAIAPANA